MGATRPGSWVIASLLVIVAAGAFFPSGCSSSACDAAAQNERAGRRIVAALERYHTRCGRYPAKLRDLIPNELDELPVPADAKWTYTSPSEDRYELAFDAMTDGGASGWYDLASGLWVTNAN